MENARQLFRYAEIKFQEVLNNTFDISNLKVEITFNRFSEINPIEEKMRSKIDFRIVSQELEKRFSNFKVEFRQTFSEVIFIFEHMEKMENSLYYEGLYNFLSKTPSGLKSTKGDVVILITNNCLVLSIGNEVREEFVIEETTITNHSLVFEGIQINKLTMANFKGQKSVFEIIKTNKFDELKKPIFNVKYRNDEDFFTLFLIKSEQN